MQTVNMDIDGAVARIVTDLDTKNQARDRALVESRQIVRHAATGIRAHHRGEHDRAQESLSAGRSMVQATRRDLETHPDLYWTGYVQDAQKEIAEAFIVAAILRSQQLPQPNALGLEPAPFLNSTAERANEVWRYLLDLLR